ncbi:hypothetical protein MKZ38_002177 [Zalerion maritima]|uniref:Uncharacterized protein n=1 Tax=Zalerion maritima TaxID=339359 RepID=A0AAD5RQQ2_9PEZI|nr:hypothetical protein MKZ38_002177 [Zalerion maritima]
MPSERSGITETCLGSDVVSSARSAKVKEVDTDTGASRGETGGRPRGGSSNTSVGVGVGAAFKRQFDLTSFPDPETRPSVPPLPSDVRMSRWSENDETLANYGTIGLLKAKHSFKKLGRYVKKIWGGRNHSSDIKAQVPSRPPRPDSLHCSDIQSSQGFSTQQRRQDMGKSAKLTLHRDWLDHRSSPHSGGLGNALVKKAFEEFSKSRDQRDQARRHARKQRRCSMLRRLQLRQDQNQNKGGATKKP